MRLDINLASQPYEDARQFWMRWGGAVGMAGLLTLILLTLTVTGRLNWRGAWKSPDVSRKLILRPSIPYKTRAVAIPSRSKFWQSTFRNRWCPRQLQQLRRPKMKASLRTRNRMWS